MNLIILLCLKTFKCRNMKLLLVTYVIMFYTDCYFRNVLENIIAIYRYLESNYVYTFYFNLYKIKWR